MKIINKLFKFLETLGKWSAPVILLVTRLMVGIAFFQGGLAKLQDVPKFTKLFTDWGIPMPELNVYMAGSTEMVGGLLLAIGLGSRIISIPLAVTMIVALLTAHKEATKNLFNDLGEFLGQAPVPFLFVCLFVFAFGPGFLSVDTILKKAFKKHSSPDGDKIKTANDSK